MKNLKPTQPWSFSITLAVAPLVGTAAGFFSFGIVQASWGRTGFDTPTSIALIATGLLLLAAGVGVMRTIIGKTWVWSTAWRFALGLFLIGFGGIWLMRVAPDAFTKRYLP